MSKCLIPVILGPTASGKTGVGVELARLIEGEVISVDSRKVYAGLTIGTAVPEGTRDGATLIVNGIPHHLIGHRDPTDAYTAGDFAREADQLIESIQARRRVPILVGGTGFYFKALQKGLPVLPSRNPAIRQQLEDRAGKEGLEALHNELKKVDPSSAAAISGMDRHKIIRALEIRMTTGQSFSDFKERWKGSRWEFLVMGLDWPKELLDRRIEERSIDMEKTGMIEETDALIKRGYSADCPALASFGYREAVEVLQGKRTRPDFLPALIKGTKAYAKRQRTWFRTQVSPFWFRCDASSKKNEISMRMKDFLYSRR